MWVRGPQPKQEAVEELSQTALCVEGDCRAHAVNEMESQYGYESGTDKL